MKNRRLLYILIAVLVVVLGVFVIRPMLTKKPAAVKSSRAKRTAAGDTTAASGKTTARAKVRAARGQAAKSGAAQAAAPAAAEAQPAAAEAPIDSTPLTWQEDPFVRDWIMAGELRDLKLRAVTVGARSLALINDRIVAQGDTVSGKRVALITRDSVVFEFGGQRRSLKIGE